MPDLSTIWNEVSHWPAEQRRELAERLLKSIAPEGLSATVSSERREALRQLVGIWKTTQPPNAEQVERIVDEERMKKYG